MYQLDGNRIEYVKLILRVLETLQNNIPVYYAYHQGVDIYWIDTQAPDWSDQVRLEDEGFVIKGDKVIEPIDVQ